MNKYIAFLRGINVSGHHKLPMAELREEMEKLNFKNVLTILNSGNVIFDTDSDDIEDLEIAISTHLEKIFGFPVPTILRSATQIYQLLDDNPFEDIVLTKDIRLYVSFLWQDVALDLKLPWVNDDRSFKIIEKRDKAVLSVLDLSVTKTPKGMEVLEKKYGKGMTTRNWNTIKRIEKKLETNY